MSRPRIAFVPGDPNGIGPELDGEASLAPARTSTPPTSCVFADPATIAAGERVAGVKALVGDAAPAAAQRCSAWIWAASARSRRAKPPSGGRAALTRARGRRAGRASRRCRRHRVRAAQQACAAPRGNDARGRAAPACRNASTCRASFREFNITGPLWTSRVTSHIPLRDVADAITRRRRRAGGRDRSSLSRRLRSRVAADRGDRAQSARRRRRLDRPRGDRRHRAGDRARAAALGIDAVGPLSSDTVFLAAKRGEFDAVVTMYHDQGQIAMKLMGFDKGVTLHGGLPVPVATCASGTAFDIVGRNVANVEGLQQAFDLAVAIASRRVGDARRSSRSSARRAGGACARTPASAGRRVARAKYGLTPAASVFDSRAACAASSDRHAASSSLRYRENSSRGRSWTPSTSSIFWVSSTSRRSDRRVSTPRAIPAQGISNPFAKVP